MLCAEDGGVSGWFVGWVGVDGDVDRCVIVALWRGVNWIWGWGWWFACSGLRWGLVLLGVS